MCVTTVETKAQHQVKDLLDDPVGREHPIVAGAPGVRFYAGSPLRSADGFPIGTMCVLDVEPRELNPTQMGCLAILADLVMERLEVHRTERTRAAAYQAMERFGPLTSELSDLPPTGVLRLDPDGIVDSASDVASQLTGLAPGQHLTELAAGDGRDANAVVMAWESRCPATGLATAFESTTQAGSSATVLLQSEPVLADYGSLGGHFVTVRVLTSPGKISAQAVHAQKLESLGALAGGIAHDFNNMLTALMGNIGLAIANVADPDHSRRYMDNIDQSVERASALCDQLLASSGGGQFTVSTVDLSALVTEMSGLLEVGLSKKAALEIDLGPEKVAVEGDPTQVRQVIMNVLTNASESLEDQRGHITLRTTTAAFDRAALARMFFGDGLDPGRYAVFEVVDNGCGMDPAVVSQVFDPLYSTKFAGHGLGMAAVAGIMRAHRGAIEIHSELGAGTIVRLLFPETQSSIVDLTTTPTVPVTVARRRGTVLVVEDEPAVRSVVVETLEIAGYQSLAAADGAEAMTMLAASEQPICAAIVDMMMPNVDGAEFHQHITDHDPAIQVIVTSGYNERQATRRLTSEGPSPSSRSPTGPTTSSTNSTGCSTVRPSRHFVEPAGVTQFVQS